ncbi:MAG: hypothetical protein K2I77_05810 [Anaeroplasmataceae bacterium]|nr:hypothetical protein [Anaeroplasmataceae bacterium]
MLEQLFQKGYLNYNKLILDYAKPLGLGADEAFILVKLLDEFYKNGTISMDNIHNEVLIESEKMDKILASLMDRGFYEIFLAYDHGVGKECFSFEPLFSKLDMLLSSKVEADAYDIEKANQYLTSKLNRVLTANELEILQKLMLEDHYTYDEIVSTIDYILRENRILSMRSITMGLAKTKNQIKTNKEMPASFQEFIKKI